MASKPQGPFCFCSHSVEVKALTVTLGLYMGTESSNSGPLICIVNTLPTEPSSRPLPRRIPASFKSPENGVSGLAVVFWFFKTGSHAMKVSLNLNSVAEDNLEPASFSCLLLPSAGHIGLQAYYVPKAVCSQFFSP